MDTAVGNKKARSNAGFFFTAVRRGLPADRGTLRLQHPKKRTEPLSFALHIFAAKPRIGETVPSAERVGDLRPRLS
jgi:hypothetical protein